MAYQLYQAVIRPKFMFQAPNSYLSERNPAPLCEMAYSSRGQDWVYSNRVCQVYPACQVCRAYQIYLACQAYRACQVYLACRASPHALLLPPLNS